MKFYFKVRVSSYWEDPPEITTYVHDLEPEDGYADEEMAIISREEWLEQIPLLARLPDHDFLIIGICKVTSTRDYWTNEYNTESELDEIQYRSWPCDIDDGNVGEAPWKMARLN